MPHFLFLVFIFYLPQSQVFPAPINFSTWILKTNTPGLPIATSSSLLVTDNVLRSSVSTAAWSPNLLYLGSNFSISFNLTLLSNYNGGADGVSLQLHNDPRAFNTLATGTNGKFLGTQGITKSYGIYVATYQAKCLAFCLSASVGSAFAPYTNISFGTLPSLTIYFNYSPGILMWNGGTEKVDLPGILGSNYAVWGFTGSTATSTWNHLITDATLTIIRCVSLPGYYCSSPESDPSPCPQGTFSNVTGATSNSTCTSCPINSFGNTTGLPSCFACPPNTYTSSTGGVVCLAQPGACPAGSFCPGGTTTGCPSGWVTASGSSFCFKLFTSPTQTGTQASLSCRTVITSGSLMSIRSSTEWSIFLGLVSGNGNVYLGLSAINPTCGVTPSRTCTNWTWDRAGQSNAFIRSSTGVTYWAGGEPNNAGGEYCVAYEPARGGLTDIQCINPRNYACETPAVLPVPCPAGTFSTAVGATSNATCTPCASNTFTNTSGLTSCYPCPPQTYSNSGASVCLTTAGVCPAGSYCPSGTTAGCPSGWVTTSESAYCFKAYSTLQSWSASQSSCRTSDPAGTNLGRLASIRSAAEFSLLQGINKVYSWIGLHSTPNVCGSNPTCAFWIWDQSLLSNSFILTNNFWSLNEPNSINEQCVEIVINTNGMNDANCGVLKDYICEIEKSDRMTCPLGTYCPIASTSPLNCSAGTYSSTLGASQCTPCINGTYSTTVGAAVCDLSPCLPGYFCPTGSASPVPCPVGRFNGNSGGVSLLEDCSVCPAGYFTNTNTSATECQPCPETFYCPANTTDPVPCPPGTGFSTNVTKAVDCGTASPTPTRSPTPTMTPTMTPPPRSCLNVPGRCATPSPSAGDMVGVLGVSVPRPPSLTPPSTTSVSVSWPALGSALSVSFPLPPSTGEITNVTCWGGGGIDTTTTTLLTIIPVWGVGQSNCSGPLPPTPPGAACIQMASQEEGVLTPNPPAKFMVYGSNEHITPPPTSSAVAALNTTRRGVITCMVQSLPVLTSPLYPRYPLKLTLTIPLNSTRLSIPLLAGVLLESGTFGTFRLVGGGTGGVQDTFTLPSVLNTNTSTPDCVLPALASAAAGGATVSLWTSTPANLFRCTSAFDALTSLARQFSPAFSPSTLTSSSSTPATSYLPLTASLSGSRHLLLLASTLTPFPPNSLTVTLKGVACTLNWVHPTGLMASVLTPTLSALGCSTGQVCGTAPLILSFNTPAPIPGAYPPLQPMPLNQWMAALNDIAPFSPLGQQLQQQQAFGSGGGDTTSTTTTTTTLPIALGYTGLSPAAIVPLADATTPPSTGIHIVAQCTDSSYASPEDCAVVNGSQPYLPPGKVCVWGSGDNCVTCSTGALCPGGTTIYPLAGYWCPLSTSPPTDIVPCPAPGALERCPGWPRLQPTPLGAYGCGVGFRGQGCSGCDIGYFPSGGGCVTCPKAPLLVSLALPIVFFLLGLGGFGGVIMAVVWATAVYIKGRGGGGGGTGGASRGVKCMDIAPLVGDLCVWIWLSAQGVASLFRQAQSVAPGVLAPFFQAVTSLQFQGITLDPSCYSGIPFQSFWLGVGGVGVGALMGLVGSLCFSTPSTLLLNLASLTLTLGYGAITSIFSSATICTLKAPMSVIDYLNAVQDGSALKAALGSTAPTPSQLKAVMGNPYANPALASIVRSTIPVSVLAADPFQVCNEGPHAIVRPVAMLMVGLYTAGLPLFGVYLHCLTRARRQQQQQQVASSWWWGWGGKGEVRKGGVLSSSSKPTTPRPPPTSSTTTTNSPLPLTVSGWGGEEEEEEEENSEEEDLEEEEEGVATNGKVEEEEVEKPPPLPPRPRATAIEVALVDATLLPAMQWTQFFEMGALAVITGLTSLAQGAGILPPIYFTCQAGVMGVCLVSIWVVGGVRKGWGLYFPNHAWKNPVKASLYGVTALSALTCILLFSLPPSTGSDGVRLGLAGLILTVTGGVALLLLVQWWRSLFVSLQISFIAASKAKMLLPPPVPPPPPAPTPAWDEGEDSSNPPTPPPIPRPPYEDTLWRRHQDEDQDIYWWRPSDGAVQWTLEGVEVGEGTLCGWEKREGDGRWEHGESGALSDHPPHTDVGMCERVLQEGHFHRLVVDGGEILGVDAASLPPMLVLSPAAVKEREFKELMSHGEEALKVGYTNPLHHHQQQLQAQGHSRAQDEEFQALVQSQSGVFAGSSVSNSASSRNPSSPAVKSLVVGRGRRDGDGSSGGGGRRGEGGVPPLYSTHPSAVSPLYSTHIPTSATTTTKAAAGDDDFNALMSHGDGLL